MKNKSISILLAIFLGGFGAHWFYLRKRKAWFYLLFCWTILPATVAWVDAVLFALDSTETFNEKYSADHKEDTTNKLFAISNDLSTIESKNHAFFSSTPRKALQFLESIELIKTSKNCDIIIGRYAFIQTVYDQIIEAKDSRRFIVDITTAVDSYKSAYYDKELSSTEVGLLIKPNRIELANYYGYKLAFCFINYVTSQAAEINKLKLKSAKMKRFDKILAVASMVLEELNNQKSLMTKSDEYYEIVEKFREKIIESIDQYLSK